MTEWREVVCARTRACVCVCVCVCVHLSPRSVRNVHFLAHWVHTWHIEYTVHTWRMFEAETEGLSNHFPVLHACTSLHTAPRHVIKGSNWKTNSDLKGHNLNISIFLHPSIWPRYPPSRHRKLISLSLSLTRPHATGLERNGVMGCHGVSRWCHNSVTVVIDVTLVSEWCHQKIGSLLRVYFLVLFVWLSNFPVFCHHQSSR